MLLHFRSHLLPNRFRREFSLPSFDIKDLDTVDDMVRSMSYIIDFPFLDYLEYPIWWYIFLEKFRANI